MLRLLWAIIFSSILVMISLMSEGLGDIESPFQTWFCTFFLPLWSIGTIGLWYDTGRFILSKTFDFDSNKSEVPTTKRSIVFIIWMSVVFTYISWVHISLFAVPMMIVIPILGFFLKDYLFMDWSVKPEFTFEHGVTISLWALFGHIVYWVLNILWIISRVWFLENFDAGTMYYIQ
jgi:hypothetical protein